MRTCHAHTGPPLRQPSAQPARCAPVAGPCRTAPVYLLRTGRPSHARTVPAA
ncbi:hypothetical protein DSM19430T_20060 [Desulfovibrio psychrotolerans]|uniref:Uncharacterized protein n=1 Tax=Desulfovibrio psychrotolerans TaxID=415242 RepID=A0A7J0BVX2_9BACT|nr:hypothetical protein DSM19430T_20060 [Desulfovibrio psychrotolerans]